ncbi:MAG: alpha/beta fold hydrolase [Planctomycetes bacterium]|nr:alpha/beta fold hydrolase [Planctomycetota bacterium]
MLVSIRADTITLEGDLSIPRRVRGLVLFAHGSGSSRHSPRNRQVAKHLQDAEFATLLMDLLTEEEDAIEGMRFDIALLARRLREATRWTATRQAIARLPLGYFGASTGAAVALQAAVEFDERVMAVVSRGGRPDLAWEILDRVRAPTLLIVGSRDEDVLQINREALERLGGPKRLAIVEGATHLFEEPGALEEVAELAAAWFRLWVAREKIPA